MSGGAAPAPPRARRVRNGPSTEGRILDVAVNLFAQHGFDSVSISQLAGQAGVTIGALYHHFASKEAVYDAAARRAFAAKANPPPEVMRATGTARERLTRLIAWFVGAMVLDRNFGLLLKRELLDPRPTTPELIGAAMFRDQLLLYKQLLGELLPGADQDEAVAAALALLFGYTNLRGLRAILPGIDAFFDKPERIAEHVVQMLLQGLR